MSQKNVDTKNRWRTKTIAFRMSPEEAADLEDRVRLCGARTKQEYIIESLLNQTILAKGNPMMLVQFRKDLQKINAELVRINNASEMDEELLSPIRTMLEIMEAFKENEQAKQ